MKKNQAAFIFSAYQFMNETGQKKRAIAQVPATINYQQALKNTIIWTSTVLIDLKKLKKRTSICLILRVKILLVGGNY